MKRRRAVPAISKNEDPDAPGTTFATRAPGRQRCFYGAGDAETPLAARATGPDPVPGYGMGRGRSTRRSRSFPFPFPFPFPGRRPHPTRRKVRPTTTTGRSGVTWRAHPTLHAAQGGDRHGHGHNRHRRGGKIIGPARRGLATERARRLAEPWPGPGPREERLPCRCAVLADPAGVQGIRARSGRGRGMAAFASSGSGSQPSAGTLVGHPVGSVFHARQALRPRAEVGLRRTASRRAG